MPYKLISIAVLLILSNSLAGQESSMELLDQSFSVKEPLQLELIKNPFESTQNPVKSEAQPSFESITIARSMSLLSFDGFEVKFEKRGAVTLRGSSGSKLPGWRISSIDELSYTRLCNAIHRLDLDNPERRVTSVVWDRPFFIIRVRKKDGEMITVSDRGDVELVDFELLAAYVDKLLQRLKWEPAK